MCPSPFFDLAPSGSAILDELRIAPGEASLEQLGVAVMTELLDLVLGSALEPHVVAIAEGFIGGLHASALRLERTADRSRDALARRLREFDGSEVADHDLQAAKAETDSADAAVRAVGAIRDAAAEAYATATGEAWSPPRGGVRPSPTTAAQVDAAHALRARQALTLAEADVGREVVAFRGAPGAASPEDAMRIFDALNWALARWPAMSLALTGAPGAEQIAKRWAVQKGVTLVLARPDFDRHGRAAPFRANDALMALEPVCVLALSTSLASQASRPFGPVLNLVQRAREVGVRCVRIRSKAAPEAA